MRSSRRLAISAAGTIEFLNVLDKVIAELDGQQLLAPVLARADDDQQARLLRLQPRTEVVGKS